MVHVLQLPVKNERKRGNAMKQLILLVLIAAVLYACNGSGTGSSDGGAGPGTGSEAGAGTISSGVSAPALRRTLPASWDENWFGSPAVFDLDKDGGMEIIAGRHSVLYVWRSTGTLLWRAPVGESASSPNDHGGSRQYASPVVGDLDGDSFGEIAVAYSNQVAVYRRDGELMPGWPRAFPGTPGEIRSIAADDLDRDGRMEILAQKTSDGPVTMVWRITGEAFPGWPQVQNCAECNEYGGYNQNIGSADLDGDGAPEVVSTYDCCHIGIMRADGSPLPANPMFSGPYVSSVPMFHDLALAVRGWGDNGNDRDEFTDSPPVFGDLDGDSLPEIILYSDHERAGEYVNRGNALWALNPDLTRAAGFDTPICSGGPLYTGYEDNIVQVAPAPALAQLAGDGRPEIVVPSYDGFMRCYSPGGEELWAYRFDSVGSPFIGASGAAIGDLDHDGSSEIVFTTYSTSRDVSRLVILDAAGNALHIVPIQGRGSMAVPTLADVDGDGKIEILVSLKDTVSSGLGGVQIWDVSSARSGSLPWPTGRGNQLRNGRGG